MLQTSLLLTCQLTFLALGLFLEGDASDFKDLGKLVLGGFVLAVAAGVAFTVVRLRLRDKKPPAAQFISINSDQGKK